MKKLDCVTHGHLVARAQRWVRSQRYPIVLADVRSNAISEQPDVIGFRTSGDTCVVECKTSRSDFRRDEKKFVRSSSLGMGYYRWYFVPAGLIVAGDIPDVRWGLAWLRGDRVKIVRKPEPVFERNMVDEQRLLVTALRRATEGWGRRMFGDIAPTMPDGDPHPSASKTIRKLRQEIARLRDRLYDQHREAMLLDGSPKSFDVF
jgi:hypothetical protein